MFNSTSGREGDISINNERWKKDSKFDQLISYIPQEDLLRPRIKVIEYMMMVANLKMGYSVSEKYKTDTVSVSYI